MLKLVLKFLVVVIAIVEPISSRSVNLYEVKSLKNKFEAFSDYKRLCTNASDTVLERNERLFQEYEKCVNGEVDSRQLMQDLDSVQEFLFLAIHSNSTLSNQQNSVVVAAIKKYCPNAIRVMNCQDILSPIESDCLSVKHSEFIALNRRIWLSTLDFFCQKDAKRAMQFMDAKFLDFMNFNNNEFGVCATEAELPQFTTIDNEVRYPTENELCKSAKALGSCFIPKIEQLSKTVGALLTSFSTHIQTDVCQLYKPDSE